MTERKKVVVIGGSAAGPKAAARARRLDENAEITIIQKAPDLLWHLVVILIMLVELLMIGICLYARQQG
jgi:NADH dehydrogenase FAD-containing subunit